MKKNSGKKGIRWAFVVNPASGGGRSLEYIRHLNELKRTTRPEIDLFVTGKRGDATKICDRLLRKGCRRFVAIGGDGTFNEVIQSLGTRGDCVLGVFPAGSGNDYAPGAGFPGSCGVRELEEIFRCREVPVDVGLCNGRYFLNNFGAGFDAKVAHDFQKSKRLPVFLRYWSGIFRNIFFFSPAGLSMSVGKRTRRLKSMLVSVGIGRSCGGGFFLTPRACIDDGLFDVCVVADCSHVSRIPKLLAVRSARHEGKKGVEYFSARSLTLEFDAEMPAHLDGEIFFGKRFELTILPGRIRLLVNDARSNYLKKAKRIRRIYE